MFQPVSAGAAPLSTIDMSYDVPPMSTHSRFGKPFAEPTCAEPVTPPAGPDASTRIGATSMSPLVHTPALACITIRRRASPAIGRGAGRGRACQDGLDRGGAGT